MIDEATDALPEEVVTWRQPAPDEVWDAATRGLREKTETERNAPRARYGLEGLYIELKARKGANKLNPPTTDELLTMVERVESGKVKG